MGRARLYGPADLRRKCRKLRNAGERRVHPGDGLLLRLHDAGRFHDQPIAEERRVVHDVRVHRRPQGRWFRGQRHVDDRSSRTHARGRRPADRMGRRAHQPFKPHVPARRRDGCGWNYPCGECIRRVRGRCGHRGGRMVDRRGGQFRSQASQLDMQERRRQCHPQRTSRRLYCCSLQRLHRLQPRRGRIVHVADTDV